MFICVRARVYVVMCVRTRNSTACASCSAFTVAELAIHLTSSKQFFYRPSYGTPIVFNNTSVQGTCRLLLLSGNLVKVPVYPGDTSELSVSTYALPSGPNCPPLGLTHIFCVHHGLTAQATPAASLLWGCLPRRATASTRDAALPGRHHQAPSALAHVWGLGHAAEPGAKQQCRHSV